MDNQWLQYGPVSNKFRQTYMKGFLDVSGNAIIRNGNIHLTHGDISMNGAIFNNGTDIITQITDTSNNLLDLQTRVDASLNTITTNLVTTDASLNLVTTNLVTTDASLNTITTNLVTTDASLNTLTTNLVTTDASLNALTTNLVTTDASLNLVTTNLVTTDASLNALTTNLVTTDASLNLVTTNLVTTDASLNLVTTNLVTTDASLNTLTGIVELKRDISNLVFDGSMQLAGNLIPNTTGIYDIGTSTKRFRSIYVNEAHLSVNTLYIGDTPILGTNANTIEIKADANQSIDLITTGSGNSKVQSEHDITILTSGTNADVKVQATGTNSKVRLSGTGGIEMTSNIDAQADLLVGGNLTVTGNVISNGTQFTVNSTTVTTADNIIVLNSGEVGSGVTSGVAGLQVDRGDSSDFQLLFDESTDKIKTGFIGGSFTNIATETYVDASVNALATRVTTNETDIGILDVSMNAVETRVTINETDIGILDVSMNAVETRVTTTETDIGILDVSMNAIETRVTTTETDIGILDVSMNAIETRVTINETDIGILDVSMNAVETRVTTNETDIGILDVSMNAVETRVTTNETDIGILDVSMNAIETRVTINETDIGILDVSMNAVETRVTINETDIGILDVSMNAVETRVTTNETDIGILDVSMNAVETRVTINETDIGILDVSMNAVETRVTINETDIGILDVSMNAVEETLDLKANIASPTFTGTVSGITSSMVGLSNVDNTSDLSKPVSTAQQTALDLKANIASPTFTGTVSGITSSMVGLSNVDNTSDLSKPVSTAQQTALDLKANIASPTFTGTVSGITSSMVGLSNVDNTSDLSKPVSTAQQTALDLKANLASPTFTGTVSGITSSMVGLSNVDNTSDLSKPVSTAQQTALDLKANLASPTFTGTVSAPTQLSTDNTTKVATTAYVKTVVGELVDGAPGTIDTLNELAAALGDDPNFATTVTNSIASKATIDSPTFTGTVGGITKTMVGLSNVDNTSDLSKPVSTAQQTALDLKANIASPTFTGTVSATTFVGDGSQLTGLSTSNDIVGDLDVSGDTTMTGDLTLDGGFLYSKRPSGGTNGFELKTDDDVAGIDLYGTSASYVDLRSGGGVVADYNMRLISWSEYSLIYSSRRLDIDTAGGTNIRLLSDTEISGNFVIENTSENPKLTLWSKLTGNYAPTIDLVRESETFGADSKADWRITNDGGTFKIQSQGTFSGYTGLRTMLEIGATDAGLTLIEDLIVNNSKEINYKGQTLDARFVNVAGDTMTGDLTTPILRTSELRTSPYTPDYLNYINMYGGTNQQSWLRFRRSGSTPAGETGIMFGNFDNNNYLMRNADGTLKINWSNVNASTERTGAGAVASGTEIFALTSDGDLSVGGNITLSGNAIKSVNNHLDIHPNGGSANSSGWIELRNTGTIVAGSLIKFNTDTDSSDYGSTRMTIAQDGDITMTGTLSVPIIQGVSVENNHKIRLWGVASTYSIGFSSGFSYGGLGTEYATTFTMNSTANRGWLFRQDGYTNSQGCMSLTNAGKLTIASNTRIGYGINDTTAPSGAMLDVNGIIKTEDVLCEKTAEIYGNPGNTNKRIQLSNKSVVNSNDLATSYWKVATLPVSGDGTKDYVELKATGGYWSSSSGEPRLITIKCLFRNRLGFTYNYSVEGNYPSVVRELIRVRCFNNASKIDVYIYLVKGFTMFKYDIDGFDCDVITDPTPISVANMTGSGTMVFDSGDASTYPVNQTINVGDTNITGDLTVSSTNEIYYKGETLDARFHSLDNDYYTEAESDARFVNVTGDTINGNLSLGGSGSLSVGGNATINDAVQADEFVITNSTTGNTTRLGYLTLGGDYGVYIGHRAGAGASNISTQNTAVGYECMYSSIDARYSVCMGYRAGYHNRGDYNNFIGHMAGYGTGGTTAPITGDYNIGIGWQTLQALTSGYNNVCIGIHSATAITTGYNNVCLGDDTLRYSTTGKNNTVMGQNAMRGHSSSNPSNGNYNVAIGWNSQYYNSTGSQNTSVGYESMQGFNDATKLTTGYFNTCIGRRSLFRITSGVQNTALGYNAMGGDNSAGISGNNNVCVGYYSGYNITNGANNTFMGYDTGRNSTGSNNLFIGYGSGSDTSSVSYRVGIGYDAEPTEEKEILITAGASNKNQIKMTTTAMRLIFAGVEKFTMLNGNVGIGIETPISKLHIYQNSADTGNTAGLTIEQDGTGDALLQYLTTSNTRWTTGIDNSDSDKFKIRALNPVAVDAMTITTAGDVSVAGDATINTTAHVGRWGGSPTGGFACFSYSTLNTTGGYALLQYSSGATYLNSNGTQALSLRQNNTDRLVINSSGNVEITNSLTAGKLKTNTSLHFTTTNLGNLTGQTAGTWTIGPYSTNNNLIFYYGSFSVGYLREEVDVSDINFTGQHHNYGISELIDETGFIVSSTGKYRNQMTNCDECNKYKISINESLPIVEYSQQINDTKVWGVISDKDDTNTIREKPFGNFVSQYKQAEEDRPLTINSLGEGAVWVSNINGPIKNGDYITTCVLPGLGMKQDDDVLHSYTVAKITTDCSFDEIEIVPRKKPRYETITKTREKTTEVEKDVFDYWEDDYDDETYYENIEQQIIDTVSKTIQEDIITYDVSGIPSVQVIEKTVEEEVPRLKQVESTDVSGNIITTEVPDMETVSITKTRKIPKMIDVILKDASNNDLLDSLGNPIIKQYQAKKAVYKKEITNETITESYDVDQAVIDPVTHQYVYDYETDNSGNTLYVEKYEMKYIVVSTDKFSVYNDGAHTDLYKEFPGDFTNTQVNGESIIGKIYKMAFLGCTYHCG